MKNDFIVGYSRAEDNNGYDYSNTVSNNGYLGSRSSYQNDGSFYSAGDTSNKLSNHISSHSLINSGNQASVVGGNAENVYGKYPVNDRESEYAGYSKTYETPDSESYDAAAHAASIAFGGYSGSSNNAESLFNAYSGSVHKDSDFGQYAAGSSSSSQRMPSYPSYPLYPRPTVLESYSEGAADTGDIQEGYRGSSNTPSYAESDRVVYRPYSPDGGPVSEYSFGKQKNSLHNLKGSNKYGDIYSMPTETRYTRGHAMTHNRDVPPYVSGSASGSRLSKVYGAAAGIYSSGKPYKYGHKYLSRYAPNSGLAYLSRERDGHYVSYGKGNGKIIIIKDGRPNYFGDSDSGHVYSDESLYAGYRSKSGGYSASPNFDRYSRAGSNNDNGPIMLRRYRTTGGNMIVQKTVYPR